MFLINLLFLYIPAVFGYFCGISVLVAYIKKRRLMRKLKGVLSNAKKEK